MTEVSHDTIYKVSSLDDALKLALEFKKTGKYDVFRGQAQNWPVLSSLYRDGEKNFEKNKDKIERFYYFFSGKTALRPYLDNTHDVFAIAQHYGLPTPYIDFTFNPEVAAYFATNSSKNKLKEIATIICVNSNDFAELIDLVKPAIFEKDFLAEFVMIDVANLWRLQTQEGCFLYSPFAGIENIYCFDRIEFPFTHKYDKMPLSQIYPERKSSLEILLDNYFHNERLIEWREFVEKTFPEMERRVMSGRHNIFDYINVNAKKHGSWANKRVQNWHMSKRQHWNDVQSSQHLEINLYNFNSLMDNFNDISSFILAALESKMLDRDFIAYFIFIHHKRRINKKDKKEIEKGCINIWDGMRVLPYSNGQIAKCIARYVILFLCQSTASNGRYYFSLIPNAVYIQMNCHDGSSTRAHVCGYKVLSAIRSNINNKISDKHKEILTDNPIGLVQCINIPQYLFRFQKLCDLFAEDIIPTQEVMRQNPTYFNPVHLKILGLA